LPHAVAIGTPIRLRIIVFERRARAHKRTAQVQEAVAHVIGVAAREGLEFLLVERREEHGRKKVDTLERRVDTPRVTGLCRKPTKKSLVTRRTLLGSFFVNLRCVTARGFGVGPTVTRRKK